ncbi:MAG: hypothetical protein ACREJB_00645 [Planctomycetaceae bacterium]
MHRTLTISETLYAQLDAATHRRGLESIEELLEIWQSQEAELAQRRAAVERVDALRERTQDVYSEMPDSTALVQEDRAR